MQRLYGPFIGGSGAVALLALRAVAGVGLMLHGQRKIQDPFGWSGDSFPGWLQALAALSEFGGGLALVIGLLVPIASFGIVCTMAVAAARHIGKGDPFMAKEGGAYELALVYLVMALTLMLIGPGKLALDYLIFGRRPHGAMPKPAESPGSA